MLQFMQDVYQKRQTGKHTIYHLNKNVLSDENILI